MPFRNSTHMLNNDFCSYLEYQLSEAFANSSDATIRHFWCDGILLPTTDTHSSKKNVKENRCMSGTAFVGKNGQAKYELVLNLGDRALSKYSRGLDLKVCIPDPTNGSWYKINVERKTLTVQLL